MHIWTLKSALIEPGTSLGKSDECRAPAQYINLLGDEPEVNDIGARHVVRNDLDSAVRGAVRHAAVGPGHRCAGVVAAAVLPGEAEPGTEAIGPAGQI